MLEAIIFDFDGIIVDTETPDYETWAEVYREHGLELSMDLWSQGVGIIHADYDPFTHLESQVEYDIDEVKTKDLRRAKFRESLENVPPMAGVAELMREAKAAGLKIAVASNSDRPWVEGHVRQRGLYDLIDVIRNAEDVPNPKPAPDVYLAATEALGVSPDRTIAFEDSPTGVTAAIAAGIHSIAVPNSITRHYDLTHAHHTLQSIAHTTLEELTTWVKSRAV